MKMVKEAARRTRSGSRFYKNGVKGERKRMKHIGKEEGKRKKETKKMEKESCFCTCVVCGEKEREK